MTPTTPAPSDPRHVFLGIAELGARYGRGKSWVYEFVKHPDFPSRMPGGRWRLDHIITFEDLVADGRVVLDDSDDTETVGHVEDVLGTSRRKAA